MDECLESELIMTKILLLHEHFLEIFHSLRRACQLNLCFPLAWHKEISWLNSNEISTFSPTLVYFFLTDLQQLTHKHPFQSHLLLFLPVFILDLCTMDNGGCSHNCTIAPGEGILCSCPVGMELGTDNKTCQIQSFCAKHLKCSQRCMQEKATVKCACYEGWALGPDGESCKSTGEGKTGWRTGRIKIPRIFQFY